MTPEPTKDDLEAVVAAGYTYPRLASRYGIGIKRMKSIARQWPEIERQIIYNGKVRSPAQKLFGCYRAGAT